MRLHTYHKTHPPHKNAQKRSSQKLPHNHSSLLRIYMIEATPASEASMHKAKFLGDASLRRVYLSRRPASGLQCVVPSSKHLLVLLIKLVLLLSLVLDHLVIKRLLKRTQMIVALTQSLAKVLAFLLPHSKPTSIVLPPASER